MKLGFNSELPYFTKETLEALIQFRTTETDKEEFYRLAGTGAPELLRWSFQELLKLLRVKEQETKVT